MNERKREGHSGDAPRRKGAGPTCTSPTHAQQRAGVRKYEMDARISTSRSPPASASADTTSTLSKHKSWRAGVPQRTRQDKATMHTAGLVKQLSRPARTTPRRQVAPQKHRKKQPALTMRQMRIVHHGHLPSLVAQRRVQDPRTLMPPLAPAAPPEHSAGCDEDDHRADGDARDRAGGDGFRLCGGLVEASEEVGEVLLDSRMD